MFKYFFALFALLLTIVSFADLPTSPPMILEIILSFKPLYTLLSLFALIFSLIFRRFLYALIFLTLLIINFYRMIPWYQNNNTEVTTSSQQKIKLAIINVLYGNTDYQKTLNLVREEKPNIVLFIELEKDWFKEIDRLSDILPYAAPNDPQSIFEVKLKSNIPIEEFKVFPLDDPIRKTMTATLSINNKKVFFLIPHLPTPTDWERFSLRNKQINSLAKIIQNQNLPTIVIGDFNTSIWSPYYKEFIEKTNLENSRKGFGVLPTWYAISNSFPLLGASIDQILFSKEFRVTNSYLGKDIGSDHLPLISELEF